jgi:hypothetical protein
MRSGLVALAKNPRMRQDDDVIHRVLAATRLTGRGGGTLRKGRRRSSKGKKQSDARGKDDLPHGFLLLTDSSSHTERSSARFTCKT